MKLQLHITVKMPDISIQYAIESDCPRLRYTFFACAVLAKFGDYIIFKKIAKKLQNNYEFHA